MMGGVGSGPEFHVNLGSGRVGSLHLWVGLGRVNKTGSRPTLSQTESLAGDLSELVVNL